MNTTVVLMRTVRSLPIWSSHPKPPSCSKFGRTQWISMVSLPSLGVESNEMICLPVEQLLSRSEFLYNKFEQSSETRYIDEAIVVDREALGICTPGHPKRSSCLDALSWHIWTRYKQLGGMESINAVIVLSQEAQALRPPAHSLRPTSLNSLAIYLWNRYKQIGRVDDLDEAICRCFDSSPTRVPISVVFIKQPCKSPLDSVQQSWWSRRPR